MNLGRPIVWWDNKQHLINCAGLVEFSILWPILIHEENFLKIVD